MLFVWLGFVWGLLTVNAIPPDFPTISVPIPGSEVPPREGTFPLQPKPYSWPPFLWFAETKLVGTNLPTILYNLLYRESCYPSAHCFARPRPPPLPIGVLAECSCWALSLSCVRDRHGGSFLLKFPEREVDSDGVDVPHLQLLQYSDRASHYSHYQSPHEGTGVSYLLMGCRVCSHTRYMLKSKGTKEERICSVQTDG